jgi:hypothetical protein
MSVTPVKIKEILEEGGAVPYQLEALTEDNRKIYLRYRGGYLSWGFVKKGEAVPHPYTFREKIGHEYAGCADDELFKKVLGDSLVFPEGFKFESFKGKD